MQKFISLVFAMLACALVRANDKDSLRYQTGLVQLPGGIAHLTLPAGFKYIDATQSHQVLTQHWGHPPQPDLLGMVFPENTDPFANSSYAFVISYKAMGYVKDEDAGKIDFDGMMKQLQREEVADNAKRREMGYPAVHVLGWAQKPVYDRTNNVLHWAKEMQLAGKKGHTLEHAICILGRKGILSIQAVGDLQQTEAVKKDIAKVLYMAAFNEGNQHNDFDPTADQVAAWNISGLVTGKMPVQEPLIGFPIKFSNLIILGIIAALVAILKMATHRSLQTQLS